MEKVAPEVPCPALCHKGELINAPTASPALGHQVDGRRHLHPPSVAQETSTLADEVTFPEAFSQGFFFKVPTHFKAFRANYAKVHGKAIKETCAAGETDPKAEAPESLLPSQTSGGRAPHGMTVPTEGGAGGAGRSGGQPAAGSR